MHLKKYLSIFLIGFAFAVAGCSSSDSSGGISDNDQAPDTDGDGIINDNDLDIDGDGILNKDDTDIDGDGTPNAGDENPNGGPNVTPPTDTDGDGIPDVPCMSADIQWPKAELDTGTRVKIRWTLLPEGCGLTDERNIEVQATAHNSGADPKKQNSNKRRVGQNKTAITIPHNCDWDPDPTMGTNIDSSVAIQYDFSALGEALGDSKAGTAYYTEKVNHQVGVDTDNCVVTDTNPVVPLDQISHHENLFCKTEKTRVVSCESESDGAVGVGGPPQYYAVFTKVYSNTTIGNYDQPKWSVTGGSFMNIYLRCAEPPLVRVTLENGKISTDVPWDEEPYTSWDEFKDDYSGCAVRDNYRETAFTLRGWVNLPEEGSNFILRIKSEDTTISNYNP